MSLKYVIIYKPQRILGRIYSLTNLETMKLPSLS